MGAFLTAFLFELALIRLPLLTVSVASVLYIIYAVTKEDELSWLSARQETLFDVAIYVVISGTILLGQMAPIGVLDFYYPVAIGTAGLIAYRLARRPVLPARALTQIVLYAIGLRATLWFSYPAFGSDLFHLAATGWIVNVHELISAEITYYHYFPTAHTFAAVSTQLTSLPIRTGYFTLGVIQAVSIVGGFIFARRILSSVRGGLFAGLFMAVTGYHIKSGGEPFAQALLIAIVPFIFFLLFQTQSQRNIRGQGLMVGLAIVVLVTQNIAPLALLGISGVLWLSSQISHRIFPQRNYSLQISINHTIIFIFGVVGIYWYIFTDYLTYQVNRVIALLLLLDGTAQSTIQDTNVAGVPTVEIFSVPLPGLLMWAAPLLVTGLIVTWVAYDLLYRLLEDSLEDVPIQYMCVAVVVFAIVGLVFAAGSGDAVRALPIVVVLIGPVAGYLCLAASVRGTVGTLLVVGVIVLVATAGVLTPPAAKAEWSNDDYHKYLDESQLKGIDWAAQYMETAETGPYAAETSYYGQAMHGSYPTRRLQTGFNERSATTIRNFQDRANAGEPILFMRYYKSAFGLEQPPTNHVYDSGNADVFKSENRSTG
jgi:hypothetical protein